MSNVKCFEAHEGVTVIEFTNDLKVYIIYEYEDILDIPLPVLWLLKEYGERGYDTTIRQQVELLNRKRIGSDYWADVLINLSIL